METDVGPLLLLKLGIQLVGHKALQYRLSTNETVTRDTANGKVKGCKRWTVYDDTYYSFEGIPYGTPPLGDLRFKAPQPVANWSNVKDCTKFPYKPCQKNVVLHVFEGSEDCLHVNIYTKNFDSEKPYPVLVWLYGGGYIIGEASRDIYSPDYFMKEEVVLVEISYRLGPFGFLSFADPNCDVPGNAGIKDQLLALKWIKKNIHNFNGDPNNITLFGESAGASSAHILMMTDKARGLFHKAILQSGSQFAEWSREPHSDRAYRLALKCGYTGPNKDQEVYNFLRTVSAKKLAHKQWDVFSEQERRDYLFAPFAPHVEPYETSHSVITKPIKDSVKEAWGNAIPVILGGNSFEGIFAYQLPFKYRYLIEEVSNCVAFLPSEIKYHPEYTVEDLQKMGQKIKEIHFNNQEPSLKETLVPFLDVMSYKYFWHAIHRMVLTRMAYSSSSPTYLYRFDFDSPFFNHFRNIKTNSSMRGVSHADDISYLFYHISSKTLSKRSPEYKTIRRMVGMWVAFAKTGDPNIEDIGPTTWKPLDNSKDQIWKCLNISNEVDYQDLPEMAKLKLWDSFYDKMGLL